MRRSLVVSTSFAIALLALGSLATAEATRTLRIEVPPGTARLAIENLAGSMRVIPGSGDSVVAIATIHAESDDLAAQVRFERASGDPGVETYRVRYPYDRHTTFRYREGQAEGSGFWESLFGGGNTTTTYDDRKVKVSSSSGVLLYADVEVQVPRRAVAAHFRNVVGRIHGQDVEGTLEFDTGSGDMTLERLKGSIKADTGSGDVKAADVEGSLVCDTGSGDCDITGFRGESLSCDVGSGTVSLKSISAKRVEAETGSGDVSAAEIDAEEFSADTGSGDVELEVQGSRLTRVKADTGSGDVTLRLGPDASFEAIAAQGSGEIVNRFTDAEPIVKNKEVIGYRRGGAQTRIAVDTGSGDLILEPGT